MENPSEKLIPNASSVRPQGLLPYAEHGNSRKSSSSVGQIVFNLEFGNARACTNARSFNNTYGSSSMSLIPQSL
jgi:hypothetical protein